MRLAPLALLIAASSARRDLTKTDLGARVFSGAQIAPSLAVRRSLRLVSETIHPTSRRNGERRAKPLSRGCHRPPAAKLSILRAATEDAPFSKGARGKADIFGGLRSAEPTVFGWMHSRLSRSTPGIGADTRGMLVETCYFCRPVIRPAIRPVAGNQAGN
jgi:hypothetical protein